MKGRARVVAVLYVATIYLTIPFATRAWLALGAVTAIPLPTLALIFASLAAAAVVVLTFQRTRANAWTAGMLLTTGATYFYLYSHAFVEPVEKIHLIEYGALPWFIWRAFGSDMTLQKSVMVWVLSADVGVFDELIQHFTPGRVGELRDVLINWESSALGLALLATFVKGRVRTTADAPGSG